MTRHLVSVDSAAANDARLEWLWRCSRHGVGCYADTHLSAEALRASGCAPTCSCWKHAVLRALDSGIVVRPRLRSARPRQPSAKPRKPRQSR